MREKGRGFPCASTPSISFFRQSASRLRRPTRGTARGCWSSAPTAALDGFPRARIAEFLAPRRRAGRQRHEGHRGAARGRAGQGRRDRFDRGDADRAGRRLPLASACASGQEAQGRRAHPLRRRRESTACLLAALDAEVEDKGEAGEVLLRFAFAGAALDEAIERLGAPPLPPYIASRRASVPKRPRRLSDDVRRQTRRGRGADGWAAFHAGAGRSASPNMALRSIA